MNNQLLAVEMNRLTKPWVETDSQDNALATATKAAAATKTHIITGIAASYSGTVTGLLQIKDDTTVIFEHYVVNSASLNLVISGTKGNAVSAELAASGAGLTIGKVNLIGYTI